MANIEFFLRVDLEMLTIDDLERVGQIALPLFVKLTSGPKVEILGRMFCTEKGGE
jgi:hypothetical protein